MRFVLVTDAFPPMRTSGAVQLRDISREFVRQGHEVVVLTPWEDQELAESVAFDDGISVIRLKAPRTKDVNYVRRSLAELVTPFAMLAGLRGKAQQLGRVDGVIWYSPSIFFGPLVHVLKRRYRCHAYLILRDIFPEWAADIGIMGRGLPFKIFRLIAAYQYRVADTIGVQTEGNLGFLRRWEAPGRRVEVLHNWLSPASAPTCSVELDVSPLAGRKIFIYAGNMGVAQGMEILIDLAEKFRDRSDLGFIFVGRGSNAIALRDDARQRGLGNVLFFDEIEPEQLSSLYRLCHAGLVSLDPRHKTHNIPGKFLSYMQAGLPVLALVNRGNDLVGIIERHAVGRAAQEAELSELVSQAEALLSDIEKDSAMSQRCHSLAVTMFSSEAAVRQIVSALRSH